jgi:hypothetical protein
MPATSALATAVIGATSTTVTTASFTPAVGTLLVACVGARPSVSTAPTISDSLGGTWTEFAGSSVATGNIRGRMWWQLVTAATARTVTVVSASATQIAVGIVGATNANATDFSNFAVPVYNATGDPSVTLAALAANSIVIGFLIGNAGATGSTPPSGYAELYDALPATNLRMSVVHDMTSPGATLAWVSPSTDSYGFALEIKEAAGAAGSVLKVWTGSAWAEKPAKVWTGSAWVTKPVKVWNGSAWV